MSDPFVAQAFEDENAFMVERDHVLASLARLRKMERFPGDARRMLQEAFETCATALGDTDTGRRMFRHVYHIKRSV
jgi:hypothetical protein